MEASFSEGQEYLYSDLGYLRNIIKGIRKLDQTYPNEQEIQLFLNHNYVRKEHSNKEMKRIVNLSKELFGSFKDKLTKNLLTQIVPKGSNEGIYIDIKKVLSGHKVRYGLIQKEVFLLEIQRHPPGGLKGAATTQYRIFNNKTDELLLLHTNESIIESGENQGMKVEINGVWQDPPFRADYNQKLINYFGEAGKDMFWEKINTHDMRGFFPIISDEIKKKIRNTGYPRIAWLEIPENESNVEGIYMRVGKGSIRSNLFMS